MQCCSYKSVIAIKRLLLKKVYLVSWAMKMAGGPERIAVGVIWIEASKVVHFHHLVNMISI